MGWFRSLVQDVKDDAVLDSLVNRVGYRCVTLAQNGHEHDALRLLAFTQRSFPSYYSGKASFFESLAEGLRRGGCSRLACRAFVMAFAESRGGSGWHSIGDDAHSHLLDAAEELDPEEARLAFAEEAASKATKGFSFGVTKAVIHRLARWDIASSKRAWDEAFAVVERRLTTVPGRASWLPPFERRKVITWDAHDALVTAIAARCSHPEADRRGSALLSFANFVKLRPSSAGYALKHVLGKGPSPSSAVELLQVVLEAEEKPFEVTKLAHEALKQGCRHQWFGVQALSRTLLERARLRGPLVSSQPAPTINTPVHQARVAQVSQFAGSSMVKALAGLWPAFPKTLAGRFNTLDSDARFEYHHKARVQFAGEQDVDQSRWIPTVFFIDELLTQAVHESANGIAPFLIAKENLLPDLDNLILDQVLPDIHLQLGLVASRVARPPLARPNESAPGTRALESLVAPDPFQGWFRVGLYEREYVFEDQGWRQEPSAEVTHFGGLQITSDDRIDPAGPFGWTEVSTWRLRHGVKATPVLHRLPPGPLVDILMDKAPPCMWHVALMLPSALGERFGLLSGAWPGPLSWVDSNNQPVVRLRTWEVGGIRRGERPSRFSGCDLLVRPELLDRIATAAANPLAMQHVIQRKSIT